jgi:hypothetical protein
MRSQSQSRLNSKYLLFVPSRRVSLDPGMDVRSSFHLSQGGLSFTGRFVFHREVCLSQGGLSFTGRFIFHREVCLS